MANFLFRISIICLIIVKIHSQSIVWQTGNWAFACDFVGDDLSSALTRGEDCSTKCRNTQGCTHYTWTTFNNGTCWMKKGPVSSNDAIFTNNQSMVCGYIAVPIVWQTGNWAFACDFPGNNLSNVVIAGEQCSTKCFNTPQCTHYTWTTFNSGTCWMKQGNVTKNNVIETNDKSMVCGLFEQDIDLTSAKGNLLWSDEFNQSVAFQNNWIQQTGGGGWGNNELQYYTNNNQNAQISQGFLTITTKREKKVGSSYTSARLLSTRNFTYGIFEMRAKLPFGRGTWPAFWLLAANKPLNWPRDGEIDVMEHVGYDMNRVHATIHCEAYNHMIGTQISSSVLVDNVSNIFHLYQLYWTKDRISVFVDNKLYFTYKKPANSNYSQWPFDNSFNIIMNTAVGGNWGGANGVDNSIFPQQYVIDYVRHFAIKP